MRKQIVRVNLSSHTTREDLLGRSTMEANGHLVFKLGSLEDAVRNGKWLLLDELNLASGKGSGKLSFQVAVLFYIMASRR